MTINQRTKRIATQPIWFDSFKANNTDHHQRQALFRSSTVLRDHQVPNMHTYVRQNLLSASSHSQFLRLRSEAKDQHIKLRHGEETVIYFGSSRFLRLSPANPAWFNQQAYHLAGDIVRYERGTSNQFLCLESACRVHGIPLFNDSPVVHVGVDRNYSSGSRHQPHWQEGLYDLAIKEHHYSVPESDIVEVAGIRVTSLFRTLQDVLAYMPDPYFISPADALLRKLITHDDRQRIYSTDALAAVENRLRRRMQHTARTYPKRKVMRRFHQLSPLSESVAESMLRLFFLEAGFPMPHVQYPLYATGDADVISGTPAYQGQAPIVFVDMAWPQYGLAVEFDGLNKYTKEATLRREKKRDAMLALHFAHIQHFVWDIFSNWSYFTHRVNTLVPPARRTQEPANTRTPRQARAAIAS